MNMPRDAGIAAWTLKAVALASFDSIPGRLVDRDVVDLPRWQAMLALEEGFDGAGHFPVFQNTAEFSGLTIGFMLNHEA